MFDIYLVSHLAGFDTRSFYRGAMHESKLMHGISWRKATWNREVIPVTHNWYVCQVDPEKPGVGNYILSTGFNQLPIKPIYDITRTNRDSCMVISKMLGSFSLLYFLRYRRRQVINPALQSRYCLAEIASWSQENQLHNTHLAWMQAGSQKTRRETIAWY